MGVTLHLGWNHQNLPPHPQRGRSNRKEMEPTTKMPSFSSWGSLYYISLDFEESLHLFIYSSQLNLRLGFLLLMPKSLCVYKWCRDFSLGGSTFLSLKGVPSPYATQKSTSITSLKLTQTLKSNDWKIKCPLGMAYFQVHFSTETAKPRGHRTGEVF